VEFGAVSATPSKVQVTTNVAECIIVEHHGHEVNVVLNGGRHLRYVVHKATVSGDYDNRSVRLGDLRSKTGRECKSKIPRITGADVRVLGSYLPESHAVVANLGAVWNQDRVIRHASLQALENVPLGLCPGRRVEHGFLDISNFINL
jgi:hypothetical protein